VLLQRQVEDHDRQRGPEHQREDAAEVDLVLPDLAVDAGGDRGPSGPLLEG
jgi:hypothetical protein